MSLDVTLKIDGTFTPSKGGQPRKVSETVFEYNITHNLAAMAIEAGLYDYLWHPNTVGISQAQQLIAPLKTGLETLKRDKLRLELFNAKNGWGKYHDLVEFVEEYLKACIAYPDADVFTDV